MIFIPFWYGAAVDAVSYHNQAGRNILFLLKMCFTCRAERRLTNWRMLCIVDCYNSCIIQ